MLAYFSASTLLKPVVEQRVAASGDDGDGKTDMLYVAKNQSKASGIARSGQGALDTAFQSWPSNYLGIPWSGNLYNPIIADFNGDGRADIFLQRTPLGITTCCSRMQKEKSPAFRGPFRYANTITGGSVSASTHDPASPTGVVPASAVGHTVGSFAGRSYCSSGITSWRCPWSSRGPPS